MKKTEEKKEAKSLWHKIKCRKSDIFDLTCILMMGLWYFFWAEYAFPRIYNLGGKTLFLGGYVLVSLYIALHFLINERKWTDFVSVTAVPAALMGLVFMPPAWVGTALATGGGCIAISVIIAAAVFFTKYKKKKLADRMRMSCNVGRNTATVAISAFFVIAALFSAISLNVRASLAVPSGGAAPSENEEKTDSEIFDINENWNVLSPEDKLAALQKAADYICEDLEIEPITVKVGAFEGTLSTTRYNNRRNEVSIAVTAFESGDYYDAFFAVARGSYNAYQTSVARRYKEDPASFDGEWYMGHNAGVWADEIKYLNGSAYWKYWDDTIENNAEKYAREACDDFEYRCLQYAVKNGDAVLSEPMKINSSGDDYWLAVYRSHVEIYTFLESEKAVSLGVLAPVEEFEDINKTLESVEIDENLTYEENADILDDVIQIADRDRIYRYACNTDTHAYELVSSGWAAEPEKVVYLDIEWENNPIDSFFERYVLHESTSSNADMTAYEIARGDMWLAEVDNAYRLMKESINPNQSEEAQEKYAERLQQTYEDFLSYAENGTNIEALTAASNVFAINDDFDGVYAGTALSGYHSRLLADTYRAEALRMYGALEYVYDWADAEAEDIFVFDEEKLLADAEDEYGIIFVEWEE